MKIRITVFHADAGHPEEKAAAERCGLQLRGEKSFDAIRQVPLIQPSTRQTQLCYHNSVYCHIVTEHDCTQQLCEDYFNSRF
jgi:hypothetical protein